MSQNNDGSASPATVFVVAHDNQPGDLDHWKTVYTEVRRAYEARVNEVAKQQDRLATVLAANGLVFALIGGALPGFKVTAGHFGLSAALFVAGLCVLACGLIAGGIGLWPRIQVKAGTGGKLGPGIENHSFLDAGDVLAMGETKSPTAFYQWLAGQIQDDAARSNHVGVLNFRRWTIRIQIACISVGALVLVAAALTDLLA